MASTLFPVREPIASDDGLINPRWQVYFRGLEQTVASGASNVIPPVTLTSQSATIGSTPFGTDAISTGLYRVTYYGRVTAPAGTSSNFTVSIGWTDGGVSCSTAFTVVNGNTTSTTGSGTYMVNADAGSPISYSVAYNSVPAAAMVFTVSLALEAIGA